MQRRVFRRRFLDDSVDGTIVVGLFRVKHLHLLLIEGLPLEEHISPGALNDGGCDLLEHGFLLERRLRFCNRGVACGLVVREVTCFLRCFLLRR